MNLSNHIRKSIDLGKTKSVDMSSQIEKTLKSHRTYNESQEEVPRNNQCILRVIQLLQDGWFNDSCR